MAKMGSVSRLTPPVLGTVIEAPPPGRLSRIVGRPDIAAPSSPGADVTGAPLELMRRVGRAPIRLVPAEFRRTDRHLAASNNVVRRL